MERVLEPELMDDDEQVMAFARADSSDSNNRFVGYALQHSPDQLRRVLDLGCGPADVDIRLAGAHSGVHITAVDGSGPMIEAAKRMVAAAHLTDRVRLHQGYIPGLDLEEQSYDAVFSKDMLHHLPDPMVLWREALRLGRPGAAVCIMDLARPSTVADARSKVVARASTEPAVYQEDFFNSLLAAFTPDEVSEQTKSLGIDATVTPAGNDLHMLIRARLP